MRSPATRTRSIGELVAAAEAERAEAVARRARDAHAAAEREARRAAVAAHAWPPKANPCATSSTARKSQRATGSWARFGRWIARQSLSEILDVLVDGRAAEAARVGMFLRKRAPPELAVAGFGDAARGRRRSGVPEARHVGEAARTGTVDDRSSRRRPRLPSSRWTPAVAVPLR